MEETAGRVDGPAGPVAYRQLGEGPPLLLINGFAATKADWDPAFLAGLARSHTVIAPDNRGMGESGWGDGEISIGAFAADAIALIEQLEIDPIVVGWSMGGFIAQQLADDRADLVGSLALLGTNAGGPEAILGDPAVFARLADTSSTPREQASALISALFPEPTASAIDTQFGEVVAAARAQLDPDMVARQMQAMRDWLALAERPCDRITCPTLIAAGDMDQVIPADNSLQLAGLVPGSWLVRFPLTGHAFMAQVPVELADLIGLFGRSHT